MDPKDPRVIAMARAVGMTPEEFVAAASGQAGGSASSDDPPVYMGIVPNVTVRDGRKTYGAEVPMTKSLSEYSKQFYGLNRAALIAFQQRAQAAGFYGNTTPRFGDFDEDTYKIWQSVGLRSARFFAAGQHFTTNDVLDMAVQSIPADQQQARAYATRTDVVSLQDPATIRQAAHAAFKAVTGKGGKISDEKISKFVEQFTAAQLSSQRGVNRAQDRAEQATRSAHASIDQGGSPTPGPLSQEVDYTAPDLGARAEEFARAQDPAGAGAHDIAGKFAMFTRLLSGISG
jgi:hypothetical protein